MQIHCVCAILPGVEVATAMNDFTPVQRKVFVGCFVVYAGAYVARLNLAAALPALMEAFSLSSAQGGLIQTMFSLMYATGQLVNGAIVDRISAKRYIVTGLIASAACNLLFGMAGAYWQLLVLWALNGVAQSMLWTPVVKLLAGWFNPEQRRHASMWVAFSALGGHFVAWAISGYMAQLFTWRLSFVLPGLVQLIFMGIALWLLSDPPGELVTAARGDRRVKAMPVRQMVFGTGLWLVLICCAASGFVRDGVMTWGPSILMTLQVGTGRLSATAISLVIPVINLLGVLLGQVCLRRSAGNVRGIVAALMGVSTVACLLLVVFMGGNLLAYALLLGACCALMYGVNPLETVVLPMDYARFGRVGLAAGMIDSFVYLGAAFVSVFAGFMQERAGLSMMFVSWGIAAAIGSVAMLLSVRGARAMAAMGEEQ